MNNMKLELANLRRHFKYSMEELLAMNGELDARVRKLASIVANLIEDNKTPNDKPQNNTASFSENNKGKAPQQEEIPRCPLCNIPLPLFTQATTKTVTWDIDPETNTLRIHEVRHEAGDIRCHNCGATVDFPPYSKYEGV